MDCRRCGKGFSGKSSLMAHLKGKKVCPPILADVDRDEIYNEEHNKKTHQCELCLKMYASPPTASNHKCKALKIYQKEKSIVEEPKKRGRKKKESKSEVEMITEELIRKAMKKVLLEMKDKL